MIRRRRFPPRARRPLAVLLLSMAAGAACVPAARYPEPGEPGPVVTAAGDTIPEGPDRDAFMAGYRAGYDRAREEGGPYGWVVLGGAVGGALTVVTLPLSLAGVYACMPLTVGGVGLIWASAAGGHIEPLTGLPAPVVEESALYQAGYREGNVHGRRRQPQKEAGSGVLVGILVGLTLFVYLASV